MINNTFDITSDTCDAPSHSNPILRDGTALIPPWLWPVSQLKLVKEKNSIFICSVPYFLAVRS